jgi:hypothetical protein
MTSNIYPVSLPQKIIAANAGRHAFSLFPQISSLLN